MSHGQSLTLGVMASVALAGAMAFLQVYSVQPILPVLIADLHTGVVGGGNIVGATVLAVALVSPFVGMVSDRIGRRGMIVSAIVLLSIPTTAMHWASTVEQIWWLRFFQGLFVPGITVVMVAYLGEEFHGVARVRLMTLYVAGTIFGGFVGRMLMGYLNLYFGWRNAFWVMGALCLIGAWPVFRGLPSSKNFVRSVGFAHSLRALRTTIVNPYVVSVGLLGLTMLFVLQSSFTYMVLHLADEPYRLNSAQTANIYVVYLISIVLVPISARIVARFGSGATATLSLLLSVIGILLTLLTPLASIVTGLALVSVGIFIAQGAAINFMGQHIREGRSMASGIYYMSYYAGGFAGTWVSGYIFRAGGWTGTAVLLVAVSLLGAALAWFLMHARLSKAA